jgi:hypothetical protein
MAEAYEPGRVSPADEVVDEVGHTEDDQAAVRLGGGADLGGLGLSGCLGADTGLTRRRIFGSAK